MFEFAPGPSEACKYLDLKSASDSSYGTLGNSFRNPLLGGRSLGEQSITALRDASRGK